MKSFGLKYDREHYKRIESIYVRKIDQLHKLAMRESARAVSMAGAIDIDKPFSFSDYPQVKTKVDKIFKSLEYNMEKTIGEGVKKEWLQSAVKNDVLVDQVLKSTHFKKDEVKHLFGRNLEALSAFQKRKTGGLNLSDRVWRYTNQFKGEIEMGLDVGIASGKPASQLAVDLQKYLKEPDKLFRRVRDLRGNLVLSENAKNYHPGPGVYRSSYKNSLRLARSEINMAYRRSDHERWQQLDFVVGIEIRRSNHVYPCDVCETLKGKYPKEFKFYSWHPNCRCHAISILSTNEEFIEREKARMAGEDVGPMKSVNEIKTVPKSFSNWIYKNQDRIDRAKTKPYFIKDNKGLLSKINAVTPAPYTEAEFIKAKNYVERGNKNYDLTQQGALPGARNTPWKNLDNPDEIEMHKKYSKRLKRNTLKDEAGDDYIEELRRIINNKEMVLERDAEFYFGMDKGGVNAIAQMIGKGEIKMYGHRYTAIDSKRAFNYARVNDNSNSGAVFDIVAKKGQKATFTHVFDLPESVFLPGSRMKVIEKGMRKYNGKNVPYYKLELIDDGADFCNSMLKIVDEIDDLIK